MTAAAILALETSTPVARAGVFDADSGAALASAEAVSDRHSSNLLRLCVEVTDRAGVAISDLGAITCGAGPGSFTGLRVGFAVAKGLAMPFGVPLLLVSSLEALAWDMRAFGAAGELCVPCLDAGKGQVYAALFERQGEGGIVSRSEEWAVTPQALPAALAAVIARPAVFACAGTGAKRYREILAAEGGAGWRFPEVDGPSAAAVAALGLDRYRRGQFEDLAAAVPRYGRAPDITRPKRPGP
jgi:tRNA threonylcarbamoyladenosine biosynthesis protein TsaB